MNFFILIISGLAGALSTFYLNNRLGLGGVLASSAISVISAGFFFLLPGLTSSYLTANIPLVIMGTSFIGMASQKLIQNAWVIAISGLLFPVIFLLSGSFFEGYGGSLGTTAAISLSAVYVISRFSLKNKTSGTAVKE